MRDVATRGRRVDRPGNEATASAEPAKARRISDRNLTNSEFAELLPITCATWEREPGQRPMVPRPRPARGQSEAPHGVRPGAAERQGTEAGGPCEQGNRDPESKNVQRYAFPTKASRFAHPWMKKMAQRTAREVCTELAARWTSTRSRPPSTTRRGTHGNSAL